MHATPWQLDGGVARLRLDRLSATVDPAKPAEGLVQVRLDTEPLPGARLLGIAVPPPSPHEADPPAGCHARGTDLTATFDQLPGRPVRIDGTWRAVAPAETDEFIAGVELVVSVQTSVLDCRPALAVQTLIPATETLRLVDAESGEFRPRDGLPDAPMEMRPAEGLGFLVFRLPNVELSYAEMVHPEDFRRSELAGETSSGELTQVSHHLFSGSMEKGVILRARLRGVLLPRRADICIAAACYRVFAAAEPPLEF